MITFTDNRLYAKGTCNVILKDVTTGDIYYQSNKTSTGSITPSTNLNEIRAGLGNPIAAMIPSDSGIAVDFNAADFSLWAKAAQMGATFGYAAPVPHCQIVTASGSALSISVDDGVPVAELGKSEPLCYIQEVGAQSLMMTDGTAYPISAAGAISDFAAEASKQYKVWYYIQNNSAQLATISSLIDPKVVRFEAQIAVYSNLSGGTASGTRVGWIYLTIPFLKLQGDAAISGDQSNNDTTKISGQAIAYDPTTVSSVCSDCDTSTLAYYVYAPDDASSSVAGLAIFGGVITLEPSSTAQVPVRIVMGDGSTIKPASYSSGFTYTLTSAPTGTSVDTEGVITSGATEGECDLKVTYTEGDDEYECYATVKVDDGE